MTKNYHTAIAIIYPDIEMFNPACFRFTEEEARAKKLWTDSSPMPTEEEIDAALLKEDQIFYKEKRKAEYEKAGLTMNEFIHLLIEGDDVAIQQFRQKREEIKTRLPKQ